MFETTHLQYALIKARELKETLATVTLRDECTEAGVWWNVHCIIRDLERELEYELHPTHYSSGGTK